jgi:cell division septum initiation protein DivIVA
MVNSNLSQALQESKDLRKEVAMLKEQLANLTPEHMLEALECLKKTKKKKSGK